MTDLVDKTAQTQHPETEVLFKEARRRRRRRWAVGVSVVLAASGLAGGLYEASGHSQGSSPKVVTAPARSRPFVNTEAFRRLGILAFISGGTLWVLDGARQSLEELPVPRGFTPTQPTISSDGKWLAYLTTGSTRVGVTSRLWIARANGTRAHEVKGLVVDRLFGWNPSADVVGVTTDAYVTQHEPVTTSVQLVEPGGSVRQLVAEPRPEATGPRIENAVWSPTGDSVAVSTVSFGVSGMTTVRAYPLTGGSPTTWFSIGASARLPGICSSCSGTETIADLAGWWPTWGVGFWVYSSGAVRNLDNTPLEVLTSPGATPRIIAETLSDGETDAISASPHGPLALVDSTGGRSYGIGKQVEVCTRDTLSCAALPGASVWNGPDHLTCPFASCVQRPGPGNPGSGVSFDPQWSPDGRALAYVKSPTWLTPGWPSLAWFGAHELFVWNPRTDTSTAIANVRGASVPTWSRNSKSLLYVDNDGLWLASASGGAPVEIESPLFPESSWQTISKSNLSYYGQIDWVGQFSWWSPR